MTIRTTWALGVLAALPLVAGCGAPPTSPPADGAAPASSCVPPREAWQTTVRPLVERQCGSCHGATPAYGAPHTLLDYDALLRPVEGRRPVDGIVARLMAGTMPPPGTPAPPDDAARAIVAWASCGASEPPPGRGLRVSAPVFRAPAQGPAGLRAVELRARAWPVGTDVRDLYQCFTFEAPVTEPMFIRRFEVLVDEARVLHHVVLLRDARGTAPREPFRCNAMPDGSDYLYAWAPGQDALEFPEGGLRVAPGQRFVMQMHYNNGAGVPDVRDDSGVRLMLAPPSGTEYGMVAIGPIGFSIPARSEATARSRCTMARPTRMLAGLPHMHAVGTSFTQEIVRASGRREPLITLAGWRFETQLFYHLPFELAAGDRIETRCAFHNTTSSVVRSGNGTADEMCFNFAYMTPPPAERFCDEGDSDVTDVRYAPGACAPPDAPRTLASMGVGRAFEGAAPALAGGALPDGRWELAEVALYLSTTSTPLGTLDLARTTLAGRGQAWTSAGRFAADLNSALRLVLTSGASLDRAVPVSFSGTYTGTPTTSPLTLQGVCGVATTTTLDYAVQGDRLTVGTPPAAFGTVQITPRYTFRRAP